jgi:hypothetical protein
MPSGFLTKAYLLLISPMYDTFPQLLVLLDFFLYKRLLRKKVKRLQFSKFEENN